MASRPPSPDVLKGTKAHERCLPAAAGGLGHVGQDSGGRQNSKRGCVACLTVSGQPVEGKPHSRGNGQRQSGIAEPVRAILQRVKNSERAANSERTPVWRQRCPASNAAENSEGHNEHPLTSRRFFSAGCSAASGTVLHFSIFAPAIEQNPRTAQAPAGGVCAVRVLPS